MKRKLKGLLVLVVGVLLVLIGPLVSIVPLLPGWILTVIGIFLISLYFPSLRIWIDTHTVRWPKIHDFIHRVRLWADKNIGEL